MSAIHDLINQIGDPRLRERLATEWKVASQGKKFGLVFEDHLPELLPLHKARPRRGDLVCRRQGALKDVWQVKSVKHGVVSCVKPQDETHPSEPTRATSETVNFAVDEVLVVREFGEPIFPSLVPVDAVANGPTDAPWHTLIEADNYHALQLLDYLYAGKVDCIYIDPPYNSGASDWKYNNDYVDRNDQWRHSKWLAFMERRLKLAKRLLKPNEGVLIVTIDENEVHHLGVLLEAVFPEYVRQMVTIVINPKGTGKLNFARVDEQALYCIPNVEGGVIKGVSLSSDDDEENNDDSDGSHLDPAKTHLWELRHARRRGSESSYRHQRWNQFYPLYIDEQSKAVVRAGPSIPLDAEPDFRKTSDGLTPIWPIDHDGNHRCWRFVSTKMQSLIDQQRVVLGKYNRKKGTWTINIWEKKPSSIKLKTVWWETQHDAGTHGTTLLANILGRRGAFAFPKSVYATRDAIAAVVSERPNALIIDFFAGSGTTLNAVNLLNLADQGRRRCIIVTNNEVSSSEADTLRSQGLMPGDLEWEALGICQSVTWPRSKYTILGKRNDGAALSGDFLTGRSIDRKTNRNFKQIGFVDPVSVDAPAKKKQIVALIDGLPQTLVKDSCPFIVSEEHKASILFDPAAADDWLEALDGQEHITDFYIVTPTKRVFDGLKAQINDLLGPTLVPEDEKRLMSDGFLANLAYFKLDFLDKDRITLKRAFREILPLLWLKAGAVGPRPELTRGEAEPAVFAPAGSNFVVLLEESRLARLMKALKGRTDLSHVFIVTDSDESFKAMATEVQETVGRSNPGLHVVQLYRDYLANFMINKRQDVAARAGLEAMPGAQA